MNTSILILIDCHFIKLPCIWTAPCQPALMNLSPPKNNLNSCYHYYLYYCNPEFVEPNQMSLELKACGNEGIPSQAIIPIKGTFKTGYNAICKASF